jgi:hypothetical protein
MKTRKICVIRQKFFGLVNKKEMIFKVKVTKKQKIVEAVCTSLKMHALSVASAIFC